ncbi:MAG: response regulator [Candidatus Sericytochromatia bacterium]|nr:response regulator [Candidatus Tanganyikabacteria bacterium]
MSRVRILLVEDVEDDAALVLRALQRGGFEVSWHRVDGAPAMRQALAGGGWDAILCDFRLPGFGAMEALDVYRDAGLDIPFIVISGTVGEETAVAVMKKGAHDFVLKESLARLAPALERELRDAEVRCARQQATLQIDHLKQIDTLKDEFLSMVSHELRTPVATIMGFGDILEDELAGPLTEHQRQCLRQMQTATRRLSSLIDDLLDLNRIQAGKFKLDPRPMLVSEVMEEAIAMLEPLADHKAIRLVADLPEGLPVILADEGRISQVVVNLLSNAIKFTPDGGEVRLRSFLDNDRLCCEVADSGIGISDQDLPRLFKRFAQLDVGATRRVKGTGLGLSISKSLVEAHGGEINVESALGRGSCFRFWLPVEAEPALGEPIRESWYLPEAGVQ